MKTEVGLDRNPGEHHSVVNFGFEIYPIYLAELLSACQVGSKPSKFKISKATFPQLLSNDLRYQKPS